MALNFIKIFKPIALLLLSTMIIVCSLMTFVHAKELNFNNLDIKENDLPKQKHRLRQYPMQPFYGGGGGIGGGFGGGMGGGIGGGIGNGGGCPLCDSSVYSYCSYKVLHDSCCCDFPVQQLKPPQCFYSDCSLLYAKSCYEHSLIKNCCCNSPY